MLVCDLTFWSWLKTATSKMVTSGTFFDERFLVEKKEKIPSLKKRPAPRGYSEVFKGEHSAMAVANSLSHPVAYHKFVAQGVS